MPVQVVMEEAFDEIPAPAALIASRKFVQTWVSYAMAKFVVFF